jgi:threonine dehydrogenase-like Zn-dependent dehydrogenase
MKAVVFHGVGDIRLDDVPEPTLQEPTDAILRLTAIAICGTDLHTVRGTQSQVKPGTILGHEGVGIVEQVGSDVKNVKVGDRVVVTSSISCGTCDNCRRERYELCLKANPNGPKAASAIFGGNEATGSYNGLQAQIQPGNTVAVFGCGPVGLFCILCAQLFGAGRIFAVDTIPDRLEMARNMGAEVIDYNADDLVKTIKQYTGQIGVDRAIDAVGVEANRPQSGLQQLKSIVTNAFAKADNQPQSPAPEANPQGDNWHPGEAPGQALSWADQSETRTRG